MALHAALFAGLFPRRQSVLSRAVKAGAQGWTLSSSSISFCPCSCTLCVNVVPEPFPGSRLSLCGRWGGGRLCVWCTWALLSVVRPRTRHSRLSDSHSTPNVFSSGEGYIQMLLKFALYVPNELLGLPEGGL